LNNQSQFEHGVWEQYSEDLQCEGSLTEISSTGKITTYVAVWKNCTPSKDTLILDIQGKKITKTRFEKGVEHSYEYSLVE
jgi:hypothetical protein